MAQKILSPTSATCKTPTTPTCSLMLPTRISTTNFQTQNSQQNQNNPADDEETEICSHPFFICRICNKYFQSTPKLLSCLHTFCEKCLKSYMPSNSLSISCPTCKAQVILPERGIQALQTNFFVLALQKAILGYDPPTTQTKTEDPETLRKCDGCETKNSPDVTKNSESSSLALWSCHECGLGLCSECKGTHETKDDENRETGEAKKHVVGPIRLKRDAEELTCPNHDNRPLDMFCQTCETGICVVCEEREHCQHEKIPISEAIDGQRARLKKLITALYHRHIPAVKLKVNENQANQTTLKQNLDSAGEKIETTYKDTISTIEERKLRLVEDALSVYSTKETVLDNQKRDLEKRLLRILTCQEAVNVSAEGSDQTEMMLMCKQLGTIMTQLRETDVINPQNTQENECLDFEEGDSLRRADRRILSGSLGDKILGKEADLDPSVAAEGEGLRRCIVGDETLIRLVIKQQSYSEATDESDNADKDLNFDAFLKHISSSGSTQVIQQCKVSRTTSSVYELRYTARDSGYHMLSIKLNGHQIQDSPFKVKAHRHPLPPATPSPYRRRRSNRGSSSVTGSRSASARRYQRHSTGSDFNGIPGSSASQVNNEEEEDDLLYRVGTKGRHESEFSNPQGLCALEDGGILVADSNNSSVQTFDSDGRLKTMFGVRGRKPGNLQRPTGVATSPYDKSIFVTDYENKWVSVHAPPDKGGRFRTRLGVGRLLGPKGVAIDTTGQRVVVVDNKASKVFIYNAANGRLLHKFGSRGNALHQFAGPHFVAINSENEIIVSDFHNHCCKVFTLEGDFKFAFGNDNTAKDESKKNDDKSKIIMITEDIGIRAASSATVTGSPNVSRGRASQAGNGQRFPSAGSATGNTRARTSSYCSPTSSPAKRRDHWAQQTFHVTSNETNGEADQSASSKPPRPRSCLASTAMTSSWPSPALSSRSQHPPPPASLTSRLGTFSTANISLWSSRRISVHEALHSSMSQGTKVTGHRPGTLAYPTGVAVDDRDRVIVADWLTDSVQVFDKNGTFLASVRSQSDPLYGPQGVAVTADGQIAVADSGNHCYKIYKYLHLLPQEEESSNNETEPEQTEEKEKNETKEEAKEAQ